jgi:hypothetical protein
VSVNEEQKNADLISMRFTSLRCKPSNKKRINKLDRNSFGTTETYKNGNDSLDGFAFELGAAYRFIKSTQLALGFQKGYVKPDIGGDMNITSLKLNLTYLF